MHSNLSRRDFNKLTSAALGGMVSGTLIGCSSEKSPPAAGQGKAGEAATVAVAIHACRGLNECKGQGVDGKNTCAGQGACMTAKAHSCGGKNDCKHQGGCNPPSYNDCKGKGGCGLPIEGDMWQKARARLEEEMKAKSQAVGAAPPAAAK